MTLRLPINSRLNDLKITVYQEDAACYSRVKKIEIFGYQSDNESIHLDRT